MGINHLQLSPALIAALYPESLVGVMETGTGMKTTETGGSIHYPESTYPCLGKNLLSICFLVSYPDEEFIPADQLVFLQKILSACKCTLDDITLINTARIPVKLDALKKRFNPRVIFLWGTPPAVIAESKGFPDMTISMLADISVLPVLRADQMSRDNPEAQELKRHLWISLKKLFAL
jgi:hypothetical protein